VLLEDDRTLGGNSLPPPLIRDGVVSNGIVMDVEPRPS
jgi:hypothetical protein